MVVSSVSPSSPSADELTELSSLVVDSKAGTTSDSDWSANVDNSVITDGLVIVGDRCDMLNAVRDWAGFVANVEIEELDASDMVDS